jgi:hypothetical protein
LSLAGPGPLVVLPCPHTGVAGRLCAPAGWPACNMQHTQRLCMSGSRAAAVSTRWPGLQVARYVLRWPACLKGIVNTCGHSGHLKTSGEAPAAATLWSFLSLVISLLHRCRTHADG